MKVKTGVERLDELLNGGLPMNCNALVYAPPFLGKETLLKLFIAKGLEENIPGIFVLTDRTPESVREEMKQIKSDYESFESQGMVRYIDTYSMSIGIAEKDPYTEYVDSPVNLNAISLGVNNAQKALIGKFDTHRIAFHSISTLITYTNAITTFRFMQILSGKVRQAGATTLFSIERGVHSTQDVQLFMSLMNGVIEMTEEDLKPVLRVQGFGTVRTRAWVEYKFTDHSLEVIGSFAAERI